MSAAPEFVTKERVRIGGNPAASVPRPAARPTKRKRGRLAPFIGMASAWAVFMLLCFMLVQRNGAIRAERAEIARLREEIARTEQLNLELEGKIANQVSVAEVERWALAHQMQPPSGPVQIIPEKPEAVAARPAPSPEPPEAQAAGEQQSFWQALLARISGVRTSQAAGAQR